MTERQHGETETAFAVQIVSKTQIIIRISRIKKKDKDMMDSQSISKKRIGQNNPMFVTTRLYDKLLIYLTTLFLPKSSQVVRKLKL